MDEFPNEVPEESEQLDQRQQDDTLDDRGVVDVLDEGYSPPERWSTLIRRGEHESLEQRLAEEIPELDPYSDDDADSLSVRDELEELDDGQVGQYRAGRLVARNSDPDFSDDLVGYDVGIDGAGASAEEAAMHIVPDDEY